MLQQAIANILDIQRSFLHVFIVQQIEHRHEMIDRLFDGHFSSLILTFNNPLNFTHEYGIFQNSEMRVEYS
ncbi:hypothetical protein D3C81_2096490 [compost metagenome]